MRDNSVLAGRYRVGPILAQSPYNEVREGEDLAEHRAVIVKFHLAAYLADMWTRARFLREAEALSKVAHPALAAIYAWGEHEDRPYLVMERIEGRTLSDRIVDAGPLPLAELIELGSEVLDGLAALHERGLLHRDLKPSNLMIDRTGRCHILDFGMLRAADEALAEGGIVEGTPEYMSPEQSRDVRDADVRSDLYSLGVTFYAALIGKPPFSGRTPNAVFHKHHSERPDPPARLRPELPAAVDKFMEKALAKDPDERFQSAREMNAALRSLGI